MSYITLSDAKALFEAGTSVFVDVRNKISYDQSHIPGGLSIPLSELEEGISNVGNGMKVIVYAQCT